MSLGLHSASKNTFHSNLMEMSEYFNLNNFNPDLLDTAKIKHFISLMKLKYISLLATSSWTFWKIRIL